jgi:hypothetical protein
LNVHCFPIDSISLHLLDRTVHSTYVFADCMLCSLDDYAWIPWFCSLKGNEFFCEVDDALDMILDVDPQVKTNKKQLSHFHLYKQKTIFAIYCCNCVICFNHTIILLQK